MTVISSNPSDKAKPFTTITMFTSVFSAVIGFLVIATSIWFWVQAVDFGLAMWFYILPAVDLLSLFIVIIGVSSALWVGKHGNQVKHSKALRRPTFEPEALQGEVASKEPVE